MADKQVPVNDTYLTASWKTHEVMQLNTNNAPAILSAKMQIITENWNRVVAVPYMVYMPEKDRLLMLINCDYIIRNGNLTHEAMLIHSDDHGATWGAPRYLHTDADGKADMGFCCGLTYIGKGRLAVTRSVTFAMTEPGEIWFSSDCGETWNDNIKEPLAFGIKPRAQWDPILVEKDPATGKIVRLSIASHIMCGDYNKEDYYSQGFIRFSYDTGRTWSDDLSIPEWRGINETALIRARNGDIVAACRIDKSKEFVGKIDHYEGLGISISKNNGYTWSKVKKLYEWGRHHPSMVLMPNGDIVMTYVVRLGYEDTADGYKQFGIEAVISHDNGQSWDMEHRYILARWQANRKDENYWWGSCQSTSSVLLPDGNILTAYGTGYRSQATENNLCAPRDIGLVKWRISC